METRKPKERPVSPAPAFPAPVYRDTVLAHIFEDAKRYFLQPLLAIQYAHTLMLAKVGLLTQAEAVQCLRALDGLDLAKIKNATYDGSFEDLFFFMEKELAASCGAELAGKMHTARSRNDIDMTMYRIVLRELLLQTMNSLNALRTELLALAWEHRAALMPAYTHNQPAQPTTLGHYLMAVIEIFERDMERMRAAYERVNRSPMGACAITTTGFPINREHVGKLLGFDALQVNSYGAIASVDYMTESCSVLAVSMLNLGRLAQDLLLWSTVEFGYLRLSDGYVQISSIMPQKRNPVPLEHVRALSSKAMMQAQAVMGSVHNTPFADMNDSEDDLQPLVYTAFDDGIRSLTLAAGALEEAEFALERMAECAEANFLTVTELADTLVRATGMSFRTAHEFVSAAVKELAGHYDAEAMVAAVERMMAKHTPPYKADAKLLRASLKAAHFVDVRSIVGGPAAAALEPEIAKAKARLKDDNAWLAARAAHLDEAQAMIAAEKQQLLASQTATK